MNRWLTCMKPRKGSAGYRSARGAAVCGVFLLALGGCIRPSEQTHHAPERSKPREQTIKLHKVEQGNKAPDQRADALVELRSLRESKHVRELDRRLKAMIDKGATSDSRAEKGKIVNSVDSDRVVKAIRAREALKSAVNKAMLERSIADAERVLHDDAHHGSN